MMLETFKQHHPSIHISSFKYRAINPIPVGPRLTHFVARDEGYGDSGNSFVWNEDDRGVVGMTGEIGWQK